MTDKEQIKCNYKFQDKERFDDRSYCACFDRLCEDLFFICDHNCQIYEDLKQLARKTQECEELKETLSKLTRGVVLPLPEPEVIDLTARYRKALEEIEGLVKPIEDGLSYHHWEEQIHERCQKILNIINKAKGEE